MTTLNITSTLSGNSADAAFSIFQQIHEGAMHNQDLDYKAFEETYRRCIDSVFDTIFAWKSTLEAAFLRYVGPATKTQETDYDQAARIITQMGQNTIAIGETTKLFMRLVIVRAYREGGRREDGKVDQRAWTCLQWLFCWYHTHCKQIIDEFTPLLEQWANWDWPTFSSQKQGLQIIAARATQRFGPLESGYWVHEEDWLAYFMQTAPDEWHWFDSPVPENESDDWLVRLRIQTPGAYWWLDHEDLFRDEGDREANVGEVDEDEDIEMMDV
ncbi:hypothetical protein V8F33_008985 [Rhypophila sp. PSN 637]